MNRFVSTLLLLSLLFMGLIVTLVTLAYNRATYVPDAYIPVDSGYQLIRLVKLDQEISDNDAEKAKKIAVNGVVHLFSIDYRHYKDQLTDTMQRFFVLESGLNFLNQFEKNGYLTLKNLKRSYQVDRIDNVKIIKTGKARANGALFWTITMDVSIRRLQYLTENDPTRATTMKASVVVQRVNNVEFPTGLAIAYVSIE